MGRAARCALSLLHPLAATCSESEPMAMRVLPASIASMVTETLYVDFAGVESGRRMKAEPVRSMGGIGVITSDLAGEPLTESATCKCAICAGSIPGSGYT